MSTSIRLPRELNLSTLSVLIVDDQPFFRVLLTEVLRGLGVRNVAIAHDGEDGFMAFEDMRPDVVLADWMMPRLDGIGLTRRIRALSEPALQQVPIILVTAKSERRQIDSARSSGIDEFLLKPISAKAIFDRLQEVIERPRPFVNFETYTGPCRRKRTHAGFAGPFRRFDDPIEIEDDDDGEILKRGLYSVFVAALEHANVLVKSLNNTRISVRSIHLVVSELHDIANEMNDRHLNRVCELLLGFIALMHKSGKPVPSLISTHFNALQLLLRTPSYQNIARDEIVAGLERILKRPKAA